jgi:hypothetical protein
MEESSVFGPDAHEEGSGAYQDSTGHPAQSGGARDQDSQPSNPQTDPAHPSSSETKPHWCGLRSEITENGVLLLLAWRGPTTAESLARVSGLDIDDARSRLEHLVALGLATAAELVSPLDEPAVILYQASNAGLRWLADRDLGSIVHPER